MESNYVVQILDNCSRNEMQIIPQLSAIKGGTVLFIQSVGLPGKNLK